MGSRAIIAIALLIACGCSPQVESAAKGGNGNGKGKPQPAPTAATLDIGDIYMVTGQYLADGTIQGAAQPFQYGYAQVTGTGVCVDQNGNTHSGTFFRGTVSGGELCAPDGFFTAAPAGTQPIDPFPPVTKHIGDAITVTTAATMLSKKLDPRSAAIERVLTATMMENLGDAFIVGHDYLPDGHWQDPAFECWLVRRTIDDAEWAVKVNP